MGENNVPSRFQFEVGKTYNNDIGEYRVLAMSESQLRVEYTNGERAILTSSLQARIVTRRQREADEAELQRSQAAETEKNRKSMAAAARKADMR